MTIARAMIMAHAGNYSLFINCGLWSPHLTSAIPPDRFRTTDARVCALKARL